jgi:hypothetical protein
MGARGRDGERWWGRVPAAVTVRQEPMPAALPWNAIRARLCETLPAGLASVAASEPGPQSQPQR